MRDMLEILESIDERLGRVEKALRRAPLAKGYLSVNEAAEALGTHPNTIRRWIAQGKIRAEKFGDEKQSRVRIPRSEIEKLMKGFAVPTTPS
jgi:excisionase family DNA binding protein